jgi:ABC-type antimicrobial peptide transport system permease subunit
MALGAPSWNILSLVIGQGLRIVGIGLVVGLAAALILFPFVQSVLYGVSSVDGLALASAMLVLGLAASLACLLPALRATRINPITALRE